MKSVFQRCWLGFFLRQPPALSREASSRPFQPQGGGSSVPRRKGRDKRVEVRSGISRIVGRSGGMMADVFEVNALCGKDIVAWKHFLTWKVVLTFQIALIRMVPSSLDNKMSRGDNHSVKMFKKKQTNQQIKQIGKTYSSMLHEKVILNPSSTNERIVLIDSFQTSKTFSPLL